MAHTSPHCAVLPRSVFAILVGETASTSQAQVIKLPVFPQIVFSNPSFLIFLIASASSLIVSLQVTRLHKFNSCSVTKAGPAHIKSTKFSHTFCRVVLLSYLFSFIACIASFISTPSFAIEIRACASCCDTCPSFSFLFSLIASSAVCSSIPSQIITSKACFSFMNRLVGHLPCVGF